MRFRVLILAMAVLLACSGCADRPDTANMKKSRLQAGMLSPPDTLELLLERCGVVVRGVLQNDARTELQINTTFGIEIISSGTTKSTLCLTKVLQAEGLREGDCISIYEPYYVVESGEEPCLFYLSNYLPAEAGKEYIFFLNEKEPGRYIVDAVEYSRFPVPEPWAPGVELDSLTRSDLFLAPDADLETYKALYREVLDAYGK